MPGQAFADTLRLEARRALRRIARAPALSATIILSLAVGMGSVISLVGVVDTVFFRTPSGVRDAERVVAIGPWAGVQRTTYPDFVDLRDQGRSLESVAAFAIWNYSARVEGVVSPARGLLASHTLLPLLGIAPALGRGFGADENRPGAPPVALIGATLRRALFRSDRDALAGRVRIAGTELTIVGVLPDGFTAPDMSPVDLVLPIENAPWFGGREALGNRDYYWVRIVGRLRPGVSAAAASAEVTAIYRRANVGVRSVDQTELAREIVPVRALQKARRDPASSSARLSLWLTALGAAVLLIACANVASLLVARGIVDRHEIGIHMALGASTGRLAARALAEVAVLVAVAVTLALFLSRLAGKSLAVLLLANTLAPAPVDLRTGVLAATVAIVTCTGCALAPIVRARRTSAVTVVGGQSRSVARSHQRAMRALTGAQIALGVVLVSEAAVFATSLRNATRVDLGFDVERLVVADVDLRAAGFTDATATAVSNRAVDAVRRIPGVVAAGMTNAMSIPGFLNFTVQVAGRDSSPAGIDAGEPFINGVTSGFLEALSVPVRRGRLFTDDDIAAARPVIVVSERFAALYWRGEDPVGQCARLGQSPAGPCAEVIGVVGDRRSSPGAARGVAELYLPASSVALPPQLAKTFLGREIAVRVDAGRRDIASELQRTLLDVIPSLTSVRVRAGDAYLEQQMRSWRLGAVVIGSFAAIALALAAVGVFSVWSHAVAARRRELAIRGALGAEPNDLAWLVVREAVWVASAGLIVGLGASILAGRAVAALTFGVSPIDPTLLLGSGALFLVTTCAATAIPAVRAAFTDPRAALTAE